MNQAKVKEQLWDLSGTVLRELSTNMEKLYYLEHQRTGFKGERLDDHVRDLILDVAWQGARNPTK